MNTAELEGAITALTFAYLDLVKTLGSEHPVKAPTLAALLRAEANAPHTNAATKAYFQLLAKRLVP